MALHHDLSGPEPLRPGEGVKVTDLGSDHRLLSDGVERLAHGALVCPACAMPVTIGSALGAGRQLSCGFCEQSRPARDFFVHDVFDTPANEVSLVARIG